MVRDNLQNTGESIETILNQPLLIPDLPQDLPLLQAALSFRQEESETSMLKKVLDSFNDFPEAKEHLLRELDILSEELRWAS